MKGNIFFIGLFLSIQSVISHEQYHINHNWYSAYNHLIQKGLLDYDLNETLVEEILPMPFKRVTNDSKIVSLKILTKGHVNIKDSLVVYNLPKYETLKTFLDRIYDNKDYELDDSLFVKIIPYFIFKNDEHEFQKMGTNYYLQKVNTKQIRINFDSFNYKHFSTQFIVPMNIQAREYIKKLQHFYHGQWIIKTGNNFLGLSLDGPKLMSLKDWIIETKNNMIKFRVVGQNKMVDHYFNLGYMDSWGPLYQF